MSEHTDKLCSCGFTQSYPIPHEHDQTVREKAIVKHFESQMRDLLKQRKDLLKIVEAFVRGHKSGAAIPKSWLLKEAEAAIENAKPK